MDYIECDCVLTTGQPLFHKFQSPSLPLFVFQCIECGKMFLKNMLLDDAPVVWLYSPLAKAWRAGYPTVEAHEASMRVST